MKRWLQLAPAVGAVVLALGLVALLALALWWPRTLEPAEPYRPAPGQTRGP